MRQIPIRKRINKYQIIIYLLFSRRNLSRIWMSNSRLFLGQNLKELTNSRSSILNKKRRRLKVRNLNPKSKSSRMKK